MVTRNIANSAFNSKSSFTEAQSIKTFLKYDAKKNGLSLSSLLRKIIRAHYEYTLGFNVGTINTEVHSDIHEIYDLLHGDALHPETTATVKSSVRNIDLHNSLLASGEKTDFDAFELTMMNEATKAEDEEYAKRQSAIVENYKRVAVEAVEVAQQFLANYPPSPFEVHVAHGARAFLQPIDPNEEMITEDFKIVEMPVIEAHDDAIEVPSVEVDEFALSLQNFKGFDIIETVEPDAIEVLSVEVPSPVLEATVIEPVVVEVPTPVLEAPVLEAAVIEPVVVEPTSDLTSFIPKDRTTVTPEERDALLKSMMEKIHHNSTVKATLDAGNAPTTFIQSKLLPDATAETVLKLQQLKAIEPTPVEVVEPTPVVVVEPTSTLAGMTYTSPLLDLTPDTSTQATNLMLALAESTDFDYPDDDEPTQPVVNTRKPAPPINLKAKVSPLEAAAKLEYTRLNEIAKAKIAQDKVNAEQSKVAKVEEVAEVVAPITVESNSDAFNPTLLNRITKEIVANKIFLNKTNVKHMQLMAKGISTEQFWQVVLAASLQIIKGSVKAKIDGSLVNNRHLSLEQIEECILNEMELIDDMRPAVLADFSKLFSGNNNDSVYLENMKMSKAVELDAYLAHPDAAILEI